MIQIPDFSLVVLIGASSSGKSTFARAHFKPTEVLSSDFCRALVSDDENNAEASSDAFEALHYLAAKRLKRRMLTVVDATNVEKDARLGLLNLAKQYHAQAVAIVLDMPENVLRERHAQRQDRPFRENVVIRHMLMLRKSARKLRQEGFKHIFYLNSPEEVAAAAIRRVPLWTDRRTESGPFDIIGDIHGCYDELVALLHQLGYRLDTQSDGGRLVRVDVTPPAGRRAIFLGDLVDRGPRTPDVLKLVMGMVQAGTAFCVLGNHDDKLGRKLRGLDVRISHGLQESLDQLALEPEGFLTETRRFLDRLISHYVLDGGKLVVAHAGLREDMQGRASGAVRAFCLYGETTGETDEFGLPVRYPWANDYQGQAVVVYGHTPVPRPEWLNNTINLDTGCVFGGKLTALRYPEMALVQVQAAQMYAEPKRPLTAPDDGLTAQQAADDLLDIAEVSGKRRIQTELSRTVVIREDQGAQALETLSRFALSPKWLIYLPPTMSPCETSDRPGYLEHPDQALGYYAKFGVGTVVCEEKHMGSRTVVVVCRDPDVSRTRFGSLENKTGVVYTRTGRSFFDDTALEQALLARLREALTQSGFWEAFHTDWACFDCELMPWSAKAQGLLTSQYAAVGASSVQSQMPALERMEQALSRGVAVGDLRDLVATKLDLSHRFVAAYRNYCAPTDGLDGLKLAPFHLLATEGAVYHRHDHAWHMQTIASVCAYDPALLKATPYHVVDLADADSCQMVTDWWEHLTRAGGEGMVVKPLSFVAYSEKDMLLQPAVKCRGSEYLRIIYGPDYDRPENLERLRHRKLSMKRKLALQEFALGIEALTRFVNREPLRKVHECVFGVAALESEVVDPRL